MWDRERLLRVAEKFPEEIRHRREADRRAPEADRPDRWMRLSPEVATRCIRLLREAGRVARMVPKRRPCDYVPWCIGVDEATERLHVSVLLGFSADAATAGGWPPEHAHLVEFALTFLEEDPMWSRSGYTKKALACRLKQAMLTESDIARLLPILQRAVIRGSGTQEFKPLCRLAQKVRPPGLWEWLEEQRNHPDERVRRNARYMREAGTP